ncbi:hypothetical protein [Streptomyces puniciscabiei]|uniref:hypothetical protein n=1 Tax=Streptomyces puniciscabiei TaxID=164348 RepID=UPI00332CBD10
MPASSPVFLDTPKLLDDPLMRHDPAGPTWSQTLPVSVNDTYGDPFIPEQVDNTIVKLRELRWHRAPIAIFTKAGPDAAVLDKLRSVADVSQVVVFYSLTALDEGGISFDDRVVMIRELRQIFPNTLVFTRPIIRGLNDDPKTLQKFVDVAAEHTGLLVLGGLHDPYKKKKIQRPVEELLVEYCDAAGVKCFHKTSCAGAYIHGMECWVHDLSAPRNLDAVSAMGYEFDIIDDSLVLQQGTTGDINFLRMLCRSDVYIEELKSNYNLLTVPAGDHKLEATSSWFAWSENIETCLDCSYCIIKQIEYLKKMRVRIGVHPTRLPSVVSQHGRRIDLSQFRKTKLRDNPDESRHVYEHVRVAKPCFTHRYPSPEQA